MTTEEQTQGTAARAWTTVLRWRRPAVVAAAVVAAVAALAFPYSSQLLALVVIYALAVAGWNIVSGYAGQPSLGHAAFFGLGAYGAAVWSVRLEASPWVGIAVGALVAAVLGMLVGWVSWRLKVRGIYFALILFAVSELLLLVMANVEFLGGTTGLFGTIGDDSLAALSFSDPRWFVLIGGVALAAVMAGTAWLSRSGLGRQWAMVRGDEVAAEAAGIDTMRVKVIALGISALVTATAGGLYAQLQLFIQPETVFGMQTNLRIILMGFLGGAGMLWGPLLGSTLVTGVETLTLELFDGQPGVDGVAFGLLLVVAVTFFRRGIAWRRRPAASAASGAAPAPRDGPPPAASPAEQSRRAPSGEPVLTAVGLAKSFGGLTVVDGVSLELRAGTIHGLIGPNGAGKTTLLNMLTGTIVRDGGDVLLDGRSVAALAPYAMARRGIVRTFQIPRPLGDLPVGEIVSTAASASGRAEDPQASATRALAAVGLTAFADRPWSGLNGSQRRRVEVARCLAQEPRVLLLDEPMSGLGLEEIDDLVEMIRALPVTHPDMTILFVEHLMRVMLSLADHVTVLDRGRVLADGTPDEVTSDALVVDAYLGSSLS